MLGNWDLLQSWLPAVELYSAEDCAEALRLFRKEVEELLLQDSLGEDPIRKDGSYVHGTVMKIATLHAYV